MIIIIWFHDMILTHSNLLVYDKYIELESSCYFLGKVEKKCGKWDFKSIWQIIRAQRLCSNMVEDCLLALYLKIAFNKFI